MRQPIGSLELMYRKAKALKEEQPDLVTAELPGTIRAFKAEMKEPGRTGAELGLLTEWIKDLETDGQCE